MQNNCLFPVDHIRNEDIFKACIKNEVVQDLWLLTLQLLELLWAAAHPHCGRKTCHSFFFIFYCHTELEIFKNTAKKTVLNILNISYKFFSFAYWPVFTFFQTRFADLILRRHGGLMLGGGAVKRTMLFVFSAGATSAFWKRTDAVLIGTVQPSYNALPTQ